MTILYIDPQSYHNLSRYDTGMLSRLDPGETACIGSVKWDCPEPAVPLYKWFDYNDVTNPLAKSLRYLKTLLRIARYARRERVKIVHFQWFRLPLLDLLLIRYLRRQGVKVVFTAHNLLPHDSGDRYRKIYREIYHSVDTICVHTLATKQDLIREFNVEAAKIEVIPHGVLDMETDRREIETRAAELRRQHGIPEDSLVLGSLGVQSPYKGVDDIIRIWNALPGLHDNPAVRLLLVGRNNDLDYSEIRRHSNVVIVDEKVSNLDFSAYLHLADVVLLPYKAISQSGLLFSAISQERPVLINRVGGLADPLSVGNVGWIIGETMGRDLESSFLELVERREEIKTFPARHREDFAAVRSHFSWEAISLRLRDMYSKILTSN